MNETRAFWLQTMKRIAAPVLSHLAANTLAEAMPIAPHQDAEEVRTHTYLEAFGRVMVGIAPWLNTPQTDPEEEKERLAWVRMSREALKNAVDPTQKDFMNFTTGSQRIVDAAFLAEGLLRAFDTVWLPLEEETKRNTVRCMKAIRNRKPIASNWLLFSATVEAFLYRVGEPDWDPMRIDYAVKQHLQWYRGDGAYGDGPNFHFDYYNSFVIQPMLVDVITTVGTEYPDWQKVTDLILCRAERGADILEQLISPEGTFPAVGRSLAYRFGAFHLLSQMAYCHRVKKPAAVRCGLTAVLRKMMSYEGMFDENGWLKIGFCGEQIRMGESYISTGSLYLCCAVFPVLGLTEEDEFWSLPEQAWTQAAIWSGADTKVDHALD